MEESIKIEEAIAKALKLEEVDPRTYSPLVLAYIGDAVYELPEEELAVYKRGRNAKSATTAKHATMIDYRMATGFEALVGYLYLQARHDRLLDLIRDGLEKIGELS